MTEWVDDGWMDGTGVKLATCGLNPKDPGGNMIKYKEKENVLFLKLLGCHEMPQEATRPLLLIRKLLTAVFDLQDGPARKRKS